MIIFNERIREKVLVKLGAPSMSVEITDEQFEPLFDSARVNWMLYSKISLLEDVKKNSIQNQWIESYFQAICKETLGRIRGKYTSNLPIPGADVSLEYKSLLEEAEKEKKDLISLLITPPQDIIVAVYLEIGGLDDKDVEEYLKKAQKTLKEEKGIKYLIMPTRGQNSKIECIYPNFIYDEIMKEKMNKCLDGILENINNGK